MDVFAIGGLLIGGAAVFFGYGMDIQTNSTKIQTLEKEVVKIEQRSEDADEQILEQLKENKQEMRDYRRESREQNNEVNRKLDKLIERELNGD